jgi:hypothetical protein
MNSKTASPARGLARHMPVLDWGRRYDRNALTGDMVAAVIVTIMLIPQSLAYALLAGLPPEVGIYASIAPLHPVCDLRHQPHAGGRAGGGGVADDGGSGGPYRRAPARPNTWPPR